MQLPILHLRHTLQIRQRSMYFLPTLFYVVLSAICTARTTFAQLHIMIHERHFSHSKLPILYLHTLHIPQRLMYFLPTLFFVVLSAIYTARDNLCPATYHERYLSFFVDVTRSQRGFPAPCSNSRCHLFLEYLCSGDAAVFLEPPAAHHSLIRYSANLPKVSIS